MSLTMSSPSIRMNRNTPLKSYSKGLTPSKPVVFNDLENENPAMPAKGFGSTKKVSVAFSPNVKSGRKALSNLTPNSKVKYSEVAGEVVKKLSNQLSQRLELEPVKETTKECGECAEKEAKYKQIQAELINVQEDAKQYQDQYTKIQGEGARLYEVYEQKVKKIKEQKERITELEGITQELEKENGMVKEEYNKIYDAYNELAAEYKTVEEQLEAKKLECLDFSNKILKQTEQANANTSHGAPHSSQIDQLQKEMEAINKQLVETLEGKAAQEAAFEEQMASLQQQMSVKDEEYANTLSSLQAMEQHLNKSKQDYIELKAKLSLVPSSEGSDGQGNDDALARRLNTLRLSNQLLREENISLQNEVDSKNSSLTTQDSKVRSLQVEMSDLKRMVAKMQQEAGQLAQLQKDKAYIEKSFNTSLEELEAKLQKNQTQLTKQKKIEAELREALTEASSTLKAQSSSMDGVDQLKQTCDSQQEEIQLLEAQVRQQETEYNNLQYDMSVMYKKHQRSLQELRDQYRHEDYKQKYADLVVERNALKAEIEQTYSSMSDMESIDELQAQLQQELNSRMAALSTDSGEYQVELQELNREIHELRQSREDMADQLDQKSLELQATQAELAEAKHHLIAQDSRANEELNEQLLSALQELKELTNMHNAQMSEKNELEQQAENYVMQIAKFTQQIEEMNAEKAELAEFNEEERQVSADIAADLEGQVDRLQGELEQVNTQNSNFFEEIERVNSLLRDKTQEAAELREELSQLLHQLAVTEDCLDEMKAQEADLRNHVAVHEREANQAQKQMEGALRRLEESNENEDRLTLEVNHLKASYRSLQEKQIETQRACDIANEETQDFQDKLNRTNLDLQATMKKIEAVEQEKAQLKAALRTIKDNQADKDREVKISRSEIQTTQHAVEVLKRQCSELREELKQTKSGVSKIEREKSQFERQYFQSQATLARTTKELCQLREQSEKWRAVATKTGGMQDGLSAQLDDVSERLDTEKHNLEVSMAHGKQQAKKIQQLELALSEAQDNLSRVEADNDILADENGRILAEVEEALQDPESEAFQRIIHKKAELKKKLKEYKLRVKGHEETQKQLREYVVMYKNKADELKSVTERTLAEQEETIHTMNHKIQNIHTTMDRFRDVISQEPELVAAMNSLVA
mmetsp:Transcript_37216/g.73112  ORF Transcript_37216/g.73112 Transcript_37216/m.73112 type:complete len:1159 (-) Transcript_37216:383-3859(-)